MKYKGLASITSALILACAGLGIAAPSSSEMADAPVKQGSGMAQFSKTLPRSPRQLNGVESNFDNNKEQFFIHLPPSYTGKEAYGLIVFMDPGASRTSLPGGWDAILERNKLLFVAPQNVGNGIPNRRRVGLAITSALAMTKHYNIDRSRVYAAGFSGGARVAGIAAFRSPELFKGTIQSCGADFFKPVPKVAVTSADTAGHPEEYGVASVTQAEAETARSRVKFVFVTGANDFRYHFIQDIYNGGFQPGRFKALLLDIPGMGHQICSGDALESALNFLGTP